MRKSPSIIASLVRVYHGLVTVLVAVALCGAGPALTPADVAVLRELRPPQRASVFVVARDGSVRTIDGAGADVPDAPPPVAAPSFAVLTAPRLRPVIPHLVPHVPGLLAFNARVFVPTLAFPKPRRLSKRTSVRDLAWLYTHRFDESASRVPGVPVRSQVSSPFDIDSGAFHGVRANNGWSAVRVAVSIPCNVSHFATGPGYNEVTASPGIVDLETGYVYIGGWGAGPRGAGVDAGLQQSSAQAHRDEYSFYWKFATNKPITADDRFPCGGPDVVLELYPVSPTQLVFAATGVTESGERRTLTVVQSTTPDDGWTPSGGNGDDGIILKRIVSIAQPWTWKRRAGGSRRDRFTSGSYFGITGPHDLTPRFVWSRCELGHIVPPAIVPQYRSWTPNQTWTSRVPGTYTDWPPLGVLRATSGACDAAGLYLRA